MPRLSGPEEAIVALIKLLRGRPQGNQVDIQQTIAPAEVYAQALAAVIAAWSTMTSFEITNVVDYVLPAGWYEFEIFNTAGVARDFIFECYLNGVWRVVWTQSLLAGAGYSLSPFLSDGTNARVTVDPGIYARCMRMGA